jgi:lysyl-tRNA synthetase class 2
LDPFIATLAELQHCVQQYQIHLMTTDFARDTWLDIIMTHIIEPQLQDQLLFIYDFPASQAALARINPSPIPVGERFELYVYGTELANGFHELTDADEQYQRFVQDNRVRAQQGLPQLPIDENLIAALHAGIPPCAGVALGLDRLIMLALHSSSLAEILSFSAEKV